MRSVVLRRRLQKLLVVSSLGALTVALGACSSGFERFDYQSAVPQSASAQNPYPGGVDRTTTASTGGRIVPQADVTPAPVPLAVYHDPEPTYASRQMAHQQPQRQSLNTYTPTAQPQQQTYNAGNLQASPLPSVNQPASPASGTIHYVPPTPDNGGNTVHIRQAPGKDNINTASLQRQSSSPREQGWTATGGTRITVRRGETLYNLSKRYGVPVEAIRNANKLGPSQPLQAGQNIVIPTYVYGPQAGVSAPDNNPGTRAASAGIGYVGQANGDRVAVPTRKPQNYAAVSSSGRADETPVQRRAPKTTVSPPQDNGTPDYSVVTGSVSGNGQTYRVQPGDSLSAIASRHGTSVAALKQANRLNSSAIQVGQALVIPQAIDATTTASVSGNLDGVDPIVTGSTGSRGQDIASSSPELKAPEQTGISVFRWPVKGRVIEKFGETVAEGKNEGIDISVPEGTAVRSAENGVVIYTGDEISEYGKLVLVRHTDGWVSAYAHNRDYEVTKGEKVARGQIIARSGRTGKTDAPKLHFELRKNSIAVDPAKYLSGA